MSEFEYRTASFLPPNLDAPPNLTPAEWLGLLLFHTALDARECVCGARAMPLERGITFEHRSDCPCESLDVCRIVWPRS